MPIKKTKKILEKAQRYHRDINSKKLTTKSSKLIASCLREKWGRRLLWREPLKIRYTRKPVRVG
jgi:hypothetical protein